MEVGCERLTTSTRSARHRDNLSIWSTKTALDAQQDRRLDRKAYVLSWGLKRSPHSCPETSKDDGLESTHTIAEAASDQGTDESTLEVKKKKSKTREVEDGEPKRFWRSLYPASHSQCSRLLRSWEIQKLGSVCFLMWSERVWDDEDWTYPPILAESAWLWGSLKIPIRSW